MMDKRSKGQRKNNNNDPTAKPRSELDTLIVNILELVFKESNNPKEEWQQHLHLRKLLSNVMELESPLQQLHENCSTDQRTANIESFYSWAKENGLKFDGVRIESFQGYGLGLAATRDISVDELLFSIPRKLIFSEETVQVELQQFGSMSNIKLAYALMLEYLMPNSFWKPYIDLLPKSHHTIMYYTEDEIEQLRGTSAFLPALRHYKAIARQYAFIYNISKSMPTSKNMKQIGAIFKKHFCYDLYRWAVSTVMTRENLLPRSSVRSSKRKGQHEKEIDEQIKEAVAALIPFWDMVNHRHGKLTSFYNDETNEMESYAQTDFKKDDQIFMHYGDRPNADLLLHNGFINPAHPKDSVAIKLGLSTSDTLYKTRVTLLNLLQIPANGELKVLPAPDFISPQLLAFVRVFNMNEEQLDHWIIAQERAKDLLHLDCALETNLELKTWQFLQTRLMLLLRVFPTTLEDDEKQLCMHLNDQIQLSTIHAMVLQYRILEKRILSGALDYAKQRIKT